MVEKRKEKISMPYNFFEICISVSMNKVLLGYSHAHYLHIANGCFQDIGAESGTCSADKQPIKLKIFPIWPLQKTFDDSRSRFPFPASFAGRWGMC